MKEESEKAGLKLNIQKTKIKSSSPITSWQIDGEIVGIVTDFILGGSQITADGYCSHEIKRCLLLRRKSMTKLDSILKSNDVTLSTNVYMSSYGFSSSHVWMWELDHKESWVSKNWCYWSVVLEKTLKSPLSSKDIKPVNPKGNQSWIFIGRTDAEAETPILWPPVEKSWLIWKDPDAGKYWGQEEKGVTGCDVWMASPTQWMSLSKLRKIVKNREAWRAAVPGVVKSWMWLSNWTTTICKIEIVFS